MAAWQEAQGYDVPGGWPWLTRTTVTLGDQEAVEGSAKLSCTTCGRMARAGGGGERGALETVRLILQGGFQRAGAQAPCSRSRPPRRGRQAPSVSVR